MEVTFDIRFLWKLYDIFIWPLGVWCAYDYFIWPIYGTYRPTYWFFLAMSFVVYMSEIRFSSFEPEYVEDTNEEMEKSVE